MSKKSSSQDKKSKESKANNKPPPNSNNNRKTLASSPTPAKASSSANAKTTQVKVRSSVHGVDASHTHRSNDSPSPTQLLHANMGTSPSVSGFQTKSDETLQLVSKRSSTGHSSDATSTNIFATPTTFLNSLTVTADDKQRRANSASLEAKAGRAKSNEESTTSKVAARADSTTSKQPKAAASKSASSSPFLPTSCESANLKNKYSFRTQVHGHELTINAQVFKSAMISDYEFFSAHFENQADMSWPTGGMEIDFDQALVDKYLATAQQISFRYNKMLKMHASKLNVKTIKTTTKFEVKRDKSSSQASANKANTQKRMKSSEKKSSRSSSKVSIKSTKRSNRRAGRTYSSLSVDSQKISEQLEKINRSLTQVGKSASTVSKDKFLQKVDKSSPTDSKGGSRAASPSLITPTEVMVRGYVFHRKVTGGSFSTLYECSSFAMPEVEIACKHIRAAELQAQKDCLKDFLAEEIKILQRLNHPNIVEMYEIISSTTDIYIFMKFADKGTIFDYLYQEWRKPLPEAFAKRWMEQLMAALTYVHGLNIVHRDLKLENFLLDSKLTALLTDFGLGVCLDSLNARELLAVHCGTTDYMAPELHLAASTTVSYYDPLPTDIYAMGVCLFEMVNYYRPFAIATTFATSTRSVVYRQQHRQYAFNNRIFIERDCRDLVDQLLEPRPSMRPKAAAVLQHAWFASLTR